MKVPLTVNDFLRRAELLYPDRTGIVDEPDQPAESWGTLTYREVAERARAIAAGLDELGIGQGERVAMVSHNSARLITALFGVSGSGPHPRADQLPARRRGGPLHRRALRGPRAARRPRARRGAVERDVRAALVIGDDADEALLRFGVEPEPWAGDEDATATINYTSGTTARPKGVQLTHRNIWLNATTFGWHIGVSDRDVYLHTLPQFHCNGWGMLYAVTGMGGQHIVLRKVDGAEILRRVERHGVTLMCGAPAVVNMVLDAAARLGRRDPRPRPGAHRRRRRAAADAHDRAGGDRAGLGVQPDLRAHRDVAAADDQPAAGRVRRPLARRPRRQAEPGRRAGDRLRDARRRAGRGAGPQQRRDGGLLGAARGHGRGHRRRLVPHRRRRLDRRVRLRRRSPTARRT